MAKIYTKGSTVVDEVLSGAERYDIKDNDGTPIESNVQINLATSVAVAGTTINAARLNNIENGVDAIDTKVADANDLLTTGGTTTAYTLTTIGAASLATGERFRVKFNATAGATPTLNRDSKGAKSLKYYDSAGAKQACTSSNIVANLISDVVYDGTDYVVLDPAGAGGTSYDLADDIHAATSKTTPVDNDEFALVDSAASNALKKILFSNLKLEILKADNPVGTVRTFGVSTNPATLLGFGTWTAIAGKVIVGIDAGQAEFDTLDETGGSKTHTLTTAEIPAHTHNMPQRNTSAGTGTRNVQAASTGGTTADNPTASEGGGGAHNNLQPYIVKYVWQRTA